MTSKSLEEELLNFPYPKIYSRKNVMNEDQTWYYGFLLGKVRSWAHKDVKQTGVLITDSKRTKEKKYQKVYQLSKDLMNDNSFHYTTIQYNKNHKCKKHIDGKNVGESYIIGLGNYEGGELLIYYDGKDESPTSIDIKHKFYKFNGSEYYHETSDFTGERHTLVYFSK